MYQNCFDSTDQHTFWLKFHTSLDPNYVVGIQLKKHLLETIIVHSRQNSNNNQNNLLLFVHYILSYIMKIYKCIHINYIFIIIVMVDIQQFGIRKKYWNQNHDTMGGIGMRKKN